MPHDFEAQREHIDQISDLELLTQTRQVLIDDRDELAIGQFITQPDAEDDKPCHCLVGAALQACGLYADTITVHGIIWSTIPIEFSPLEQPVTERLAGLLEPCFDEVLVRARMEDQREIETNFVDIDETVFYSDLLDPTSCDRDNLTPGALVYTYNDYVLGRLGKAPAKAEAIKLYDRAIARVKEASA